MVKDFGQDIDIPTMFNISQLDDHNTYDANMHWTFKQDFSRENLSVGGNDNYTIFQTFCDNVEYIKNNDIVIIGWTSYCRFRLTDKNNWQQILPTVDFKIDGISKQTIDEIFINRESSGKYVDEINSWIKLINLYLKNLILKLLNIKIRQTVQ